MERPAIEKILAHLGLQAIATARAPPGAGCDLSLIKEGRGVLLHQVVQRGLLGAVALLVNRGAVWRPDRRRGLPADGLHTRLKRW